VLSQLSWGSKYKPLYPSTPTSSYVYSSSFSTCISHFSGPVYLYLKSFITCTLRQVKLEWSSRGGWDRWTGNVARMGEEECI
jgi:hypothetical protein